MSGKDIEEHENIKKEDWRLKAITTLAKPFSMPGSELRHEKGAAVMLTTFAKFRGHILSFGVPNMSAIFLNFSNELWQESEIYFKNSNNFVEPISRHLLPGTLDIKDRGLFFDMLEKRMGAIVFAFTALESFANDSIPLEYNYEQDRNDKKYLEKYNKEQIEKNLNLDTKLSVILPNIYNVKSPKSKTTWSKYTELKKLRDRIVHLKSQDMASKDANTKTIWSDVINENLPNYASESKELIKHYFSNKPEPRWLQKCPF